MLSFCFSEQVITSCCKGIICPTRFVLKNDIPAETLSPLGISFTTQVATNPFLMQTGQLAQEFEQCIPLKRMSLGSLEKTTGRLDWTVISVIFLSLSHHCRIPVVSDKCTSQNVFWVAHWGNKYRVVKDCSFWSQRHLGSNPSTTTY